MSISYNFCSILHIHSGKNIQNDYAEMSMLQALQCSQDEQWLLCTTRIYAVHLIETSRAAFNSFPQNGEASSNLMLHLPV